MAFTHLDLNTADNMEPCGDNITSEEIELGYRYSTASWCFVLIFVPLVAVFGILCNSAFVFVVYRVKFMQTITNIYLVNLAIADAFLLVAAFSQYIGDYVISPKYDLRFSFHTTFGCSMPNFLIYLCYYASLWTITLVSIERYLAVCHTFWHRLVSSKSRAIRMVLAVWAVSLIFASLSTPYTPIYICVRSDDTGMITQRIPYCEFYCKWCAITLYFTDVFQFLTALVVNLVMYVLIVKSLTKSSFPTEDEIQGAEQQRANQTRNTVAKMLIVNGIVFFICLFPFSIANIDSISNHFGLYPFHAQFIYPIGWAGRVLFLANSATNPVIYNVTNPRYRLAFKQAFHIPEKQYNMIHTASLASQTSHASQSTKI